MPNCDAIVVIVTFLVKIVIFLCKDIVLELISNRIEALKTK
ncbi:hypothetical protein AAFH68_23060 [Flavobacterium sp. CGRL1]